MTSHDVVARVRRVTGVKKVGHAGTLDPMATGVVVVAIGRVTRLIRFVQELPKEYVGVGRFGVATDTLDADGAILNRSLWTSPPQTSKRWSPVRREDRTALRWSLRQGRRRAPVRDHRRGETVEREARMVDVYELEMTDFAPVPYPRCRSGSCARTYVRSLVDDIARLGGAHLIASVGPRRVAGLDGRCPWITSMPGGPPADAGGGAVGPAAGDGRRGGGLRSRPRRQAGTGPGPTSPRTSPSPSSTTGRLIAVRRSGRQSRPEVVLA